MTAKTSEKTCSDCQSPMHEIRIVDKSHQHHQELEYASIDARKGWFFPSYPIAGKVVSFMCQNCGGIRLFGRPRR